MIADSPWALGSVTTRMSTWRPSKRSVTRPSWGSAPLGDVEVGHDLDARDQSRDHPARHRRRVEQDAVDAEAHAHLALPGEKWISDAPRSTAWAMIELTSLTTGRVAGALHRCSETSRLAVGLLVDGFGDRVVEPAHARDDERDVVARCDCDLDRHARAQREVVDRYDVRRVLHRDQQRAVVELTDRDHREAFGHR